MTGSVSVMEQTVSGARGEYMRIETHDLYLKVMAKLPPFDPSYPEQDAYQSGMLKKALDTDDTEYLRILDVLDDVKLFIPINEVLNLLQKHKVENHMQYLTRENAQTFMYLKAVIRNLRNHMMKQLPPKGDSRIVQAAVRDVQVAALTCGETDRDLMRTLIGERMPQSGAEFLELLAASKASASSLSSGVL